MKFEYEGNEDRECVAYIDRWGLVLKDKETVITIFDDGSGICTNSCLDTEDAIHKFYPGDKITITF